MAEKYMFFDSVDGDDERLYTADEFADYFRQLISNGIFNGGDNLRVIADGDDMAIKIKPGYAWLEGYLYKIDIEPLSLTLDSADPVLNRIDRIVIRLDKSLEKRYVRAFILKGDPSEEPITPTLTRNKNIFEISLAQIKIVAGKSFIEQIQIADERLNNSVCGIVSSLIDLDTSQFVDDWNAWAAVTKPQLIEQFNTWFESIMGDAEVDVDIFTQAFNAWLGGIQTQYEAWFNTIESGTYISYVNLGEGLIVNPNGRVDVLVDVVDEVTGAIYRWGIEDGVAFLKKVVK